MKGFETIIEKRRDSILRNSLLSDEFINFVQKNKRPFDEMMSYYKCAIMEVETKFRVLNEQYSLEYDRNPIEDIKSRTKSMESLMRKIRRKDIPLTVASIEENIHDIAGVRVICSFPDDIYMLADCLLSQDDITFFLQEGKRMITVEVQLRTIAMDFWASLEHKLRYKKDIPEDQAHYLEEEMLECANISASLDARMQHVRDVLNGTSKDVLL